jgi:GT2 family glycosyltransferase
VEYLAGHPAVGICQGPITDAEGRLVDSAGSLFTSWGFLRHLHMGEPADPPKPSRSVFAVKGAAMFLRRECIDEVGMFDSAAFAYFEEADLCWRARLAGWDVRYVAELPVVTHRTGATSTRLAPALIEFHSYKNRLRSLLKNSGATTLVRVLPRHVLLCAVTAAGAAVTGRPSALRNITRAYAWNVRHLSTTLELRRDVQRRRRRSDRDALAAVSAPLGMRDLVRAGVRYESGKRLDRTRNVTARQT